MPDLMPPPLTREERRAMHRWLCQHLAAAREKGGGYQQRRVSDETGVDPNVISWIEQRGRGERDMGDKPPHSETVRALARWAKKALGGRGFEECQADPCILCAKEPGVEAKKPDRSREARPAKK